MALGKTRGMVAIWIRLCGAWLIGWFPNLGVNYGRKVIN